MTVIDGERDQPRKAFRLTTAEAYSIFFLSLDESGPVTVDLEGPEREGLFYIECELSEDERHATFSLVRDHDSEIEALNAARWTGDNGAGTAGV